MTSILRRGLALCFLLAVGGVTFTAPAAAQSLLAGQGLGLVAEALDARARGLGGVGLGLPEPGLSMVNPASIAGLQAPALHVTFQPDRYEAEFGGRTSEATTARFPLIHVALPLGSRVAISLGYGAYLDQNWAAERDTTIQFGDQSILVLDRFASRGGVGRVRFGGAYSITERLSVGVGVDLHTGSLRDTVTRIFDSPDVSPTFYTSLWSFSGQSYSAGVRWTPSEAVALGGAITQGGTLRAEPDDATQPEGSYTLPLSASFGASGRVLANTLVAVSGGWTGWSSADGELRSGRARDTWSLGGGIEWEALRLGDRVIPFRVGGRFAALPFSWPAQPGEDNWVDERALTGGLGLRLAGGAALADLAVERGWRGGADVGLEESFWRLGVSLTVLGR
jgi:long-subunit fatty acid transport protein